MSSRKLGSLTCVITLLDGSSTSRRRPLQPGRAWRRKCTTRCRRALTTTTVRRAGHRPRPRLSVRPFDARAELPTTPEVVHPHVRCRRAGRNDVCAKMPSWVYERRKGRARIRAGFPAAGPGRVWRGVQGQGDLPEGVHGGVCGEGVAGRCKVKARARNDDNGRKNRWMDAGLGLRHVHIAFLLIRGTPQTRDAADPPCAL